MAAMGMVVLLSSFLMILTINITAFIPNLRYSNRFLCIQPRLNSIPTPFLPAEDEITHSTRRIRIGNIPWNIPVQEVESALLPACKEFGGVVSFRVNHIPDPVRPRDQGKKHQGSVEVEFKSKVAAERAFKSIPALCIESFGVTARLKTRYLVIQQDKQKTQESLAVTKDPLTKEQIAQKDKRRQHAANKRRRIHNQTKAIAERVSLPSHLQLGELCPQLRAPPLNWEATCSTPHAKIDIPLQLDPAAPSAGRLHRRLQNNTGEKNRAQRKRWQVESFYAVLKTFSINPGDRIVDFGSGSGNLVLPLAHLFPRCNFIAVDFKSKAIQILEERAKDAQLKNVQGWVGRIEDFQDDFDVGISLHACGAASDFAMLACLKANASFIISPCCIGKVKFASERFLTSNPNPDSGIQITYPRSQWLAKQVPLDEYKLLAAAADWSPQWHSEKSEKEENNEHPSMAPFQAFLKKDEERDRQNAKFLLQQACKLLVEFDRSEVVNESPNYSSQVIKMPHVANYPKSHIIIGNPTTNSFT